MRLIYTRVRAGRFRSVSDAVGQGLQLLLEREAAASKVDRPLPASARRADLAAGYKAMAAKDRKLAREWAQLDDAWPA